MAYQNHMLKSDLVSETGALGTATRFPPSSGGGGTAHGIPSGGVERQVLRKKTGTDYDVEWAYNYAVLYTAQTLNATAKEQARANIKAEQAFGVETVSGATPTITPEDHVQYVCGELTSLTITDPPATGAYVIKFDSGATATTTTIPGTIKGLESFAAAANTHYEIDVEDNYAVVGSWAVSAS